METLLEANGVSKKVALRGGEKTILKNIDLRIHGEEFVAVMGPSGSGKSTLLYNLSGMDKLSSGHVYFQGKELSQLSQKEAADLRLRSMGFVFQQSNLLRNINLFDNIVLSAYLAKRKARKTVNAYAMELMNRMGIQDLCRNTINQASGGQLQRASICRALINEPELIFCDEPTGALDSQAAKEVLDILSELHRSGSTIMIVTHDIKVAARTERVVYMLDGTIRGELLLGKDRTDRDEREIRERKLMDWFTSLSV